VCFCLLAHRLRSSAAVEALGEAAVPCFGHACNVMHAGALHFCRAAMLAWPLLASRGPPDCQACDAFCLPSCRGPTVVRPRGLWAPTFVCPLGLIAPSPLGLLIRGARVLQLGIVNRGIERAHKRLAYQSGWLIDYLTANGPVGR
jgi:hypothetical protein